MFDVHIGAPGVLEAMIDQIGKNLSLTEPNRLFYVNFNHGQQPVRQYVENREPESAMGHSSADSILRSMAHLFDQDKALISYPYFLGHSADIVGKRPFRLMDRRVSRLDDLMRSREMALHLMIVSPVDLLMSYSSLPLRTRIKLISQTKLSWANIAWRILRAAPKRSLIVWSCERPHLALRTFFETILQDANSSLYRSTIEFPAHSLQRRIESDCGWMDGIEEQIMQLDEQFEVDLQKIDAMPRVDLYSF